MSRKFPFWAFAFWLTFLPLHASPVKIACVGDSITEGSGLSTPALESYPARLQQLLGTNFVVRNYGVSGRTLLKKGDYPYWKEAYYTQSHNWYPDIVIIQLGTNDSKPYNWRYSTNFVADYEDLVATYAALTNTLRVIVCTPCPVYGSGAYDIRPGTVATNIAPAVRELAARLGLGLIDLHTRLAGHAELFPDTVHPNSKGMSAMAAVMFSSLMPNPPSDPPPSIEFARSGVNRLVLSLPLDRGGMVIQSAAALGAAKTSWSIAEQNIYHDGNELRQTNTLSGVARFYRLWQP